MGDWNQPTTLSTYSDFLDKLKDRDLDAVRMMSGSPSNIPASAMRFNRVTGTTGQFEEYSSGWAVRILTIAGGGTGATDAGSARTNLGLGSMSTQNAGTVAITGGTVTDVNLAYTATDKTIGTNAKRPARVYVQDALVIPVGIDKYATS